MLLHLDVFCYQKGFLPLFPFTAVFLQTLMPICYLEGHQRTVNPDLGFHTHFKRTLCFSSQPIFFTNTLSTSLCIEMYYLTWMQITPSNNDPTHLTQLSSSVKYTQVREKSNFPEAPSVSLLCVPLMIKLYCWCHEVCVVFNWYKLIAHFI